MTALIRMIPDNPVLVKELRVRMRGARAYWILLGYLGFLAVLVLLQYWSFRHDIGETGAGGSNASQIGMQMFYWIMVPQVFLVLFITPAITSGTLTIEREQQTMDLLTMTRLSRRSIVMGKLLSAVSFTALLIISSLPLISICFMLGGVDPAQVFSAYIEMLSASVLIGAMGIMWSSIARTTTQAVMMTYITLFLVFIFGFFVFMMRLSPVGGSSAAENTFRAIGGVWFGGLFLGLHVPEGTGFAIFCLLSGVLMTAVATVRIEMFPDRKAYILRGLCLLLFAVQFLALDHYWIDAWYVRTGQTIMVAVQPPIGVLMLTAIGLMLITPIFASGDMASFEGRRFVKYMLWGWTPAGLRRGKLASGLPFLVVACLVCLGVYCLAFVMSGHRADVTKSGALSLGLPGLPPPAAPVLTGQPGDNVTATANSVTVVTPQQDTIVATKLPNGTVQVTTYRMGGQTNVIVQSAWPKRVPALPPPPPPQKLVVPQTGDFAQGALMLVISIAGFALFCMMVSTATRSRWITMVIAYVVLLLIFVVPEIAKSFVNTAAESGQTVNLLYLNPAQGFLQMCEPASFWETRFLWFGHSPMWQVVSIAWVAIGLISLLVMALFAVMIGRENAPVPYEEQVLLA